MMEYDLEIAILEHYLGPHQESPFYHKNIVGFGIPRPGWWCNYWIDVETGHFGWNNKDPCCETLSFEEILNIVRDNGWRREHGLPELKE